MRWLLSLLSATALYAQQPALHIDLSGAWQLLDSSGTSDLGTYALPRRESLPLDTIHWLRREVAIPGWTNTAHLALTLGTLADAYEVWINGQQIGRTSEFRVTEVRMARTRTFQVPPGLVRPGAPMEIRLRAWRVRLAYRRIPDLIGVADRGPYLLTNGWNAPLYPGDGDLIGREMAVGIGLIPSVLALALAALLLVVWAGQRSRIELPLLSGYLACEALVRVRDALLVHRDWPLIWAQYGGVLVPLGIVLLAEFTARTVGIRASWVRVVAWALVAVRTLAILLRLLGQQEPEWLAWAARYEYPAGGLLVAGLAMFGATRQLRSHAGPDRVWLPWLIAMLGIGSAARGMEGVLFVYWIGAYRVQLYEIGGPALAAAISFLLIRHMGEERARLAAEFAAARELQQLLLPYKGLSGVDAVYLPALEVGGDFWQALPLKHGGQLIAVGDVSGKGLKAAMIVSLLTGALRNRKSDSPSAVLGELNHILEGGLHGGFVTAIVTRFDTDGHVTIASAGHPAPYVDGAELDVQPGLPLGVDATVEYSEVELRVGREQQITFVSDGVPEAVNPSGELFGFDRTREISGKDATEIADAALAWGQTDDITVVTVRGALA